MKTVINLVKRFFILFFTISHLQIFGASITFVVLDDNNNTVESLSFICAQKTLEPTQNKNSYTFDNLEPGTYTFYLIEEMYKNQTISIIISNQSDKIVRDVVMIQNIVTLDTIQLNTKHKVQLGELSGDHLIGSKKVESTDIDDVNASKSTNNARQIFYRSPLTNVVELDGSGIQLGIGGRGLDPHRSSNFNIRQNGYDISADALGYPESYYTPPTEALEKIEVIRGAASLQYGTQFGGVVNFKMRSSYEKPLEIRSRQTYGSFSLFNSFNSIGGTTKKGIKYFAYYQRKTGDDYRPNSEFKLNNVYGHIEMPLGKKLILGIDQTYMNYLAHQAGGLSDKEFETDPRQSNRTRNWFEVKWYVPAVSIYYFPNAKWTVNSKIYGLVAQRNSVGNLGPINRLDDLNTERDVILGKFLNLGHETRAIYDYKIRHKQCYLSTGYKIYTARNQSTQGKGNAYSTPDFNFTSVDNINNDFIFPNNNLAVFAENIFHVTKKLSITPGIRLEHIKTQTSGYYRTKTEDLAGNILQNTITNEAKELPRIFVITGLGSSYKLQDSILTKEVYTNFTQNYRSVTFSDLRINNPSLVIDSLIHDEKGWNFDIGYRAENPEVYDLDVSFFTLKYKDRIGEIIKKFPDPILINTTKRYRSNIADALVYGIEFFGEYNLSSFSSKNRKCQFLIFGNTALIHSAYINSDDPSIEGNQVEYAPKMNIKTGLVFKSQKLRGTLQSSYTSSQYSDASNADDHPSAIAGIIPSYLLVDLSLGYTINKRFIIETGINNITNTQYYTKRTTGYPGPGILPSSGRNLYFTLEVRL